MKSYIIRMTRDDQNPGDIEKVIRDLAAFLGASVNVQMALEVRTDHPVAFSALVCNHRVVETVNKAGLCRTCQMKARGTNARLQQRIDQVVADAKAREQEKNPFVMPEKRREFGGRKVG